MLTPLIVFAAISGIVIIGAWLSEGFKQMGAVEERLRRAQQDAAVAKKQAEIMLKDKTVDEVAGDLDNGKF